MEIIIHHDSAALQFVTNMDGALAYLRYTKSADGKTWNYYSTFVPEPLRGRQIAQALVKYALDYANDNQLKVIPSCPYVKKWVQAHPAYQHLITF